MDQTVQCDCLFMLRRISEHSGFSVERVHHVVTYVLGYRKVSAVWVPKGLNVKQKAIRMGIG